MSNHKVAVCCWKHGHVSVLNMSLRSEEGLIKKIGNLKAVCPVCRESGFGNQPIFIKEGRTLLSSPKVYQCEHGHATSIRAFGNGMLHVEFGHDFGNFINIEGVPEELEELVNANEISCYHVSEDGETCDCNLKPVDDYSLSAPTAAGIKTKTRVGDLWDRSGIEPVRSGGYDSDGEYKHTRSELANRERLKRLRQRNIAADRMPGRRIDKATNNEYERRSKNEVRPERLKGPQ